MKKKQAPTPPARNEPEKQERRVLKVRSGVQAGVTWPIGPSL
jgi:hypothetical protein